MLVELGPIDGGQVRSWARFARRIICELRLDPEDLRGVATDDLLDMWAGLIEQWDALVTEGESFRWSEHVDSEQAEYLLHGLERCLHSDLVRQAATSEEREVQQAFTMHIVQAFVDGLSEEGKSCQHYVDQVRTSVGAQLDH